jgi:hypothetical protein
MCGLCAEVCEKTPTCRDHPRVRHLCMSSAKMFRSGARALHICILSLSLTINFWCACNTYALCTQPYLVLQYAEHGTSKFQQITKMAQLFMGIGFGSKYF